MARLATWIRECDEPYFDRWFALCPDVTVVNARRLSAEAGGREALLQRMDGLLLSGGPDIAAEFLRHQVVPPDAPIEEPEPARDGWEFGAVAAALAQGLPVFAICKGHQVLNVALGGSLLLDIRGHDDPAFRERDVQPLRFAAHAPAGARFAQVNSSHHQAIERPGDGLEIEAWHAGDGVIEQVRLRGYPAGCLGVQYHPERGGQYAPLFEDFLRRVAETGAAGGRARSLTKQSVI
ncbi:MAG: gamma-glutamyl-gamma-aminobutyrate hydrolase family protein [Verrucomicrobia bacterium]|nr:gamma-glutamyl-gamma-aminobutyrate hydrolase family protein [Verrucomicrobiota bacterium]